MSEGIAEFARLAEAALPPATWDFIAGGAGEELTLRANRAALDAVRLYPRVLVNVAAASTATPLFGAAPMAVAPTAYHRLAHPDGELATARAARAAGIPFAVSTMSSVALEDIAAVGGDLWFQLYWLRDRDRVRQLVARAEDAGCSALMLTVDVPMMAHRPRDVRNAFALPDGVVAANIPDVGTPGTVAAHTNALFDPGLTWADVRWLRSLTDLPLIVKGLLDPDDAALAAELGAAAIVVSNHGGRQFDAAVASIDALPAVREAVGDRCSVMLDSGIRSGTDILRALALGADGVLVGRPVLWGLAANGEEGVARVLGLLTAELGAAMTLAGCPDVTAANRLKTRVYAANARP